MEYINHICRGPVSLYHHYILTIKHMVTPPVQMPPTPNPRQMPPDSVSVPIFPIITGIHTAEMRQSYDCLISTM